VRKAARLAFLGLAWLPCSGRTATDLLSAYRQAVAHDALYLSAEASSEADAKEVPKAVAGLLPSISFAGTASRNDTETTQKDILGSDVTSRLYYYSQSYAVTLRQPLYRKQNWAQFRQSQAVASRAKASLKQEGQSLALRVAAAYFEAVLAEAQLRTESARKETFERTFALTEKAFEKGAGTLTDVYEVQARRDLAGAFVIEAENALQNARMSLQYIMTEAPGPLAQIDETKFPLAQTFGEVEPWIERAEASNQNLAALGAELESTRQEVEKARSGHYPSFDLIVAHRRASNELDTLLNRGTKTSLAGIQVSVPLFSGGYTAASASQASLRVEKTRLRLEAGRREIELNVRREFGSLVLSASKVAALRQAVGSVELALHGTEKGVTAGTRTTLDVLNAQDQVFRTKVELERASCLYIMSYLRLREAAGALDGGAVQAVNEWLTPAS
jgi:outer membrane protein/protease secretion system outer membrane protein